MVKTRRSRGGSIMAVELKYDDSVKFYVFVILSGKHESQVKIHTDELQLGIQAQKGITPQMIEPVVGIAGVYYRKLSYLKAETVEIRKFCKNYAEKNRIKMTVAE